MVGTIVLYTTDTRTPETWPAIVLRIADGADGDICHMTLDLKVFTTEGDYVVRDVGPCLPGDESRGRWNFVSFGPSTVFAGP